MEGSYYIISAVRYTYGARLFMISSGTMKSTVGGLATPRTGVSPRKKAASDHIVKDRRPGLVKIISIIL